MEKLTDAQRAKAMLLEVSITHAPNCGYMDGRVGSGFWVYGFMNKDDLQPNRTGTAFKNADDLLNALAAPEKHNCEWRKT